MCKLIHSIKFIRSTFPLLILVIVVASCRTGNTISAGIISTKQQASLPVDRDGNRYATKVLADGRLWTTANLSSDIPNSYCYESEKINCDKYGRLYIWELARHGCESLGAGWRLPTIFEWRQLITLFGTVAGDSNLNRKKAYTALLNTGTSGFNAVLGGNRTPGGEYSRMDAHGFYWTATEKDSSTAWFSNFAKGSQALYEQYDGEKAQAFSVRCVKSTDKVK